MNTEISADAGTNQPIRERLRQGRSFLVPYCLRRFNRRLIAVTGGVVNAVSMIIAAFTSSTTALGVCFAFYGLGSAVVYMSVTISLNEYFPKRFVLVNTVSMYGSSAGAVALPIIVERSLEAYGERGALLIVGAIAFHAVACGATILPLATENLATEKQSSPPKTAISDDPFETAYTNSTDAKVCQRSDVECLKETCDAPLGEFEQETTQGESDPFLGDDHSNGETRGVSKLVDRLLSSIRETFPFKEPLFTFTAPANIFFHYALYAWMLFLVPHTEQLGVSHSTAVYMSTAGGIGGLAGRTFFIITVVYQINIFSVYIVIGIICSLSFILDFLGSVLAVRATFAVVQGFCFFVLDTIGSALSKELIVDDSLFDKAFGITCFMTGVGATTAGYLTGNHALQHSIEEVLLWVRGLDGLILVKKKALKKNKSFYRPTHDIQ